MSTPWSCVQSLGGRTRLSGRIGKAQLLGSPFPPVIPEPPVGLWLTRREERLECLAAVGLAPPDLETSLEAWDELTILCDLTQPWRVRAVVRPTLPLTGRMPAAVWKRFTAR